MIEYLYMKFLKFIDTIKNFDFEFNFIWSYVNFIHYVIKNKIQKININHKLYFLFNQIKYIIT